MDKIQLVKDRVHYRPLWLERHFLERSGIHEMVVEVLHNSGWEGLLTLHESENFVDTSEYSGIDGSPRMRYQHRGEVYFYLLSRVPVVFEWPTLDIGKSCYEPQYG